MKKFNCILLVDDNKMDVFLAEKIIEPLNLAPLLITSSNGIDALKKVNNYFIENQRLPDLMLIDIQMPLMNGFELVENIRKHPAYSEHTTRIIIISADLDEGDITRIRELSIKHVLLKPLDRDELLAFLRS